MGDLSGIGTGNLAAVSPAYDVDALAGAFLGRVDDVQAQLLGHVDRGATGGEQVARWAFLT